MAQVCRTHGVAHYLPLRQETKIYQRRKVTVQLPLFKGYVFVDDDPEQRIHLHRTNQIIRWMQPENESVLRDQLEQIRLALLADPRLEGPVAFRPGRRVRIKGGVFMGIEGVLGLRKGKSKVRLNVEMIAQSVALDVDADLIEFIDD